MGIKAKDIKKIMKLLTYILFLLVIGCQSSEDKIHDIISTELKEDKSIVKFEIIKENNLNKLIITTNHLDTQNLDKNMIEKINIFHDAFTMSSNSVDTNTRFKVIFINNQKSYESKEYNLFDFK